MKRELRDELNRMSKEVFGTSSRWQKIYNSGVAQPVERDREVMVPTRNGIEKRTFTDKKSVVQRYTVDEVRKLMEDILEQRAAFRKQLAEKAAPSTSLQDKFLDPVADGVQVGGTE